jgi:carbonic anhydrase
MDYLLRGIHQFRNDIFDREKHVFEALVKRQNPSCLFIACSDSRVVPSLITQSGPGDLFELRNAGNMVPPYGASNGGEAATIEYAVSILGVKDIVVCGHTGCGAMKALLDPGSTAKVPIVRRWLEHAETTRRIIEENYQDVRGDALLNTAVQEHVLVQIENLQTHPSVASKLQRDDLALHGWVYELETGNVLVYSNDKGAFEPVAVEDAI